MSKAAFAPQVKRRGNPIFMQVATIIALAITSSPMTVSAFKNWNFERTINSYDYKTTYGRWETISLPEEFKLNTIHGAVLPTGNVLLIAGSGNNAENFNAYSNQGVIKVLKTVVYNPEKNTVKMVETPTDVFCAGHAFLQSGNLLVAGGTVGYEVLEGDVKRATGQMVLHNENPDAAPIIFKKGTIFTDNLGRQYLSKQEVTLKAATKIVDEKGKTSVTRSSAKVLVEAVSEDDSYITDQNLQYKIDGVNPKEANNIYGQGGPMTKQKIQYQGDNKTYEFNPETEEYVRVGDMNESRWYASLPVLTDGRVLAVSGLDNTGVITETTEWYHDHTKNWSEGPRQALPTYPALFRTNNPDVLFYSGSNAGYGPDNIGRTPGFWNVVTNTFKPVEGLRNPVMTETSASVVLPPAKGSNDGVQSNRVMIAGGGGIGESEDVTDRVDIIDLNATDPRYMPAADLPAALRYINLVVTPWDEIFGTGGSSGYRAKGNSYSHMTFSYNPTTNQSRMLAKSPIGRSYHAGALLLRDGRILVFGNDPLFEDKDNTTPGKFEQRIEVFTPPQFFSGERPSLDGAPSFVSDRGQTLNFNSLNSAEIKTARLIPPSSSTHVTNIEQRSVAAIVKTDENKVSITLPTDKNVLPKGWYMLFVVDDHDRPSVAKMVYVQH